MQEQFQRRYPDVHLNEMSISRVVIRLRETGSVQDKKKWATNYVDSRKTCRCEIAAATVSKGKSQKSCIAVTYVLHHYAESSLKISSASLPH
jgi:hypothetical protein